MVINQEDLKTYPSYPLPWKLLVRLVLSALRAEGRSFRADAQACVSLLGNPPHAQLKVIGLEKVPETGPYLVTINHYTRPGFDAWWLALAVGAVIPRSSQVEMHWIVTAAWTFSDPLRKRVVTPLTRWAFSKMARTYGFTPMPPMPPDPEEAAIRARAVRQVLRYARRERQAVIGFSPEGRDFSGGRVGQPPPGVGRFIQHLCSTGMPVLPVGIYEQDSYLIMQIGDQYELDPLTGFSPDDRDQKTSQIVMKRISALLPVQLRPV